MRYAQPYERSQGPLYRQPSHRNKRLVTVPERVGAHVRQFFAEMRRQGRVYDDIQESSGVLRATMKSWRHRSYPSLPSIEAAFNSLGWDFVPVPAIEILPADIAADLSALAERMRTGLPETWTALLDIALQQRDQRERAAARLTEIDAARAARKTKRH